MSQSSAICDAYKGTSAWHFITSDSATYPPNPNDQKGDLYSVIRIFAHQLAGSQDNDPLPNTYRQWLAQCQLKITDHSGQGIVDVMGKASGQAAEQISWRLRHSRRRLTGPASHWRSSSVVAT